MRWISSLSCLLLGCLLPCACGGEAGPRAVPVVVTWADLSAQPPIQLDGDAVARLGVEAISCPKGGGVLLYCHTEGYAPRKKTVVGRHLGPFFLEEVRAGETPREHQNLVYDYANHDFESPLLFCRAIHLGGDPSVTVRITTAELKREERRVVAEVTVKATEDAHHGWMPWAGAANEGDQRPRRILTVPVDGRAAPLWEGRAQTRLVKSSTGGLVVTGPLPRLYPTDTSPGLQIEHSDGSLYIAGPKGLKLPVRSGNYLTRWWVNGAPVPAAPLRQAESERLRGIPNLEKEKDGRLWLPLALDPARLKAKSGDRIELQLLLVRGGWTFLGPEVPTTPYRYGDGSGWRTVVSNRITIQAP